MRLGVRAGRGKRESARRQTWHARAFALAAALAAVTFTAGCAALGSSAAGGPGSVTVTRFPIASLVKVFHLPAGSTTSE